MRLSEELGMSYQTGGDCSFSVRLEAYVMWYPVCLTYQRQCRTWYQYFRADSAPFRSWRWHDNEDNNDDDHDDDAKENNDDNDNDMKTMLENDDDGNDNNTDNDDGNYESDDKKMMITRSLFAKN